MTLACSLTVMNISCYSESSGMIVNCCLVCNRLVRKLLSELMLVLLVGIVYGWVRKYLNCIFFNQCNHNDRKCVGL